MSRTPISVGLFTALGILLMSICETQAGFKGTAVGLGTTSSIAIDPAGRAHMSYLDNSNPTNFILKHAFVDARGRGRIETVDTGDVGFDSSIAVDALGRIHISYHADKPSPLLKYALFDGSSWTAEAIDDGGFATSIAVDANNQPRIAYHGGLSGTDLRYATFDGSNWSIETIPGTGIPFTSTSLALTPDGKAHIGFSEATLPRKARHATNATGAWVVEDVVEGIRTSIALDGMSRPHLVCTDETARELRYAVLNGSTWTLESIVADGDYGDIAVDSSGIPQVSFGVFAGGIEHLGHARRDGGTWSITMFATKNAGFDTAIALDSFALPHISTRKSVGEASLLHYYFRLEPELEPAWVDVSVTMPSNQFVVTGRLRVSNTATGAAKRFTVSYFLSDDALLDPGDPVLAQARRLPAIQAGGEATRRFLFRSGASPSGKFLIALIESEGSAEEVDPDNNLAAVSIP